MDFPAVRFMSESWISGGRAVSESKEQAREGTTMLRVASVVTVLSLLCVSAVADTVTVSQTLTYKATNTTDPTGPYFIPPGNTMDHAPFHRGMWEDWGWRHDMNDLVPADATGVASAKLKIRAWVRTLSYPDVDAIYAVRTSGGTLAPFMTQDREFGDPLYLPVTSVGNLAYTDGVETFANTELNITDSAILADLWNDRGLTIFMNIDMTSTSHRITLCYATLTVSYIVPSKTWEPTLPVYRFYSPRSGQHVFTARESEKTKLMTQYSSDVWTYEEVGFYTYPENRQNDANTYAVVSPVYRFWCPSTDGHVFIIRESEKDKLLAYCDRSQALRGEDDANGLPIGISSVWTYEGIAFYAHPVPVSPDTPPAGSTPIYRFWSDTLHHHFFTADNDEAQRNCRSHPTVWTDEGITWYAYTAP
jgi:hypothetical protein